MHLYEHAYYKGTVMKKRLGSVLCIIFYLASQIVIASNDADRPIGDTTYEIDPVLVKGMVIKATLDYVCRNAISKSLTYEECDNFLHDQLTELEPDDYPKSTYPISKSSDSSKRKFGILSLSGSYKKQISSSKEDFDQRVSIVQDLLAKKYNYSSEDLANQQKLSPSQKKK